MHYHILISLVLAIPQSTGEIRQETNSVKSFGLPELTKEILEKIKAATGHPIDTTRFIPILTAASKEYEIIEQQPYTKTSEFVKANSNKKLDGGFYHSKQGNDARGKEKKHHYEVAEKGEDGEDFHKSLYGDNEGVQHKYHKSRFTQKNYHKEKGGTKGGKTKKGRKRGKFRVEKGFRDIYHKDEEKKSDYFWNNKHEEGKWIQYGLRNRKTEKSHDKGNEEKKVKKKEEESKYEKKEDKCTKCKTR